MGVKNKVCCQLMRELYVEVGRRERTVNAKAVVVRGANRVRFCTTGSEHREQIVRCQHSIRY
jgi:hypothetical protein